MASRRPLLTLAILLVAIKSLQLAIDPRFLFYDDSGAFLLNGLGYAFIPERSPVYGALIRIFAIPFHSLPAIVVMQVAMGGLTAWLLGFILLRYFAVRPWIAILAAVAFACDPVQVVHERLIMTETSAMLGVALFLTAALKYQETLAPRWLAVAALIGIFLAGLRIVYVPVVLVFAIVLPVGVYLLKKKREPTALAMALLVSCVSTVALHAGYRALTGWIAHREPAYHYRTGDFLVTLVAPLMQPEDARDARVADAIRTQAQSAIPLSNPDLRTLQMWDFGGFVARLHSLFPNDPREANRVGSELARATIRRDPLGFLRLGLDTYLEYWWKLPRLPRILAKENGSPPYPVVTESGARMIAAVFGVDVSKQHLLLTPSRRYHYFGRFWNVVLLISPLLAGLALLGKRSASEGEWLLFVWSLLLFVATFWGASEVSYRYLHPFSLTAIAALAMLGEKWASAASEVGEVEKAPASAISG